MDQLEVIIVNDGTPDNSAEMSREYVKRYPETFRQIDKENGGHGSAWNVGLKEAKGKYLRFLDSDDWFTDLDRLMKDLEACESDIVFNPFVKEFSYEHRSELVDPIPISGVSRIDPAKWGSSKYGYNNVNFWSATYRTGILKPLQPLFAEKTMFDDYIITWAPLVYGRTYMSLDYPVSVPSDLMTCIDQSIIGYAGYIFPYMIFLPLEEARKRLSYLWKNYLSNRSSKSKLMKRYALMPDVVFYYVEHLRRKIRRI